MLVVTLLLDSGLSDRVYTEEGERRRYNLSFFWGGGRKDLSSGGALPC